MSQDGWVDWNGGVCPVPPGTRGLVRLRNSEHDWIATGDISRCRWNHWEDFTDIIAYKVVEEPKVITDAAMATGHEAVTFHALPVGGNGGLIGLPVVDAMKSEPGLAVNPKDAVGATKLPLHLWPAEATAMGCLGMLEGELKYGRNNMVAGEGVVASIYIDAAKRHLDAWFAGEEYTHDTKTPHLANALATIAIVVKCQVHGKLIDDRDYSPEPGGAAYRRFINGITSHVGRLKAMFADKKPRHFTIADVKQ